MKYMWRCIITRSILRGYCLELCTRYWRYHVSANRKKKISFTPFGFNNWDIVHVYTNITIPKDCSKAKYTSRRNKSSEVYRTENGKCIHLESWEIRWNLVKHLSILFKKISTHTTNSCRGDKTLYVSNPKSNPDKLKPQNKKKEEKQDSWTNQTFKWNAIISI